MAPLITALADEVFDCAERLAARMPGRRLDPPLLGLLDEAPAIAPLPALPELLADGRGRGIVVVYAMQSFSQAVTRWGATKAETMGNATSITAVLGGLTSPNDLADLERICGQRRARRLSTHQGTGGQGGRDSSRTVTWENEAVLRADQNPYPAIGAGADPVEPPPSRPGSSPPAVREAGLARSPGRRTVHPGSQRRRPAPSHPDRADLGRPSGPRNHTAINPAPSAGQKVGPGDVLSSSLPPVPGRTTSPFR